jgi:hypothetical protein
MGPGKPVRRGEESKVLGADGCRARAMGWATGISKVYIPLVRSTYMERGPNGVRTSLRGGGRVQGLGDATRGLWVGQQGSASAYSSYKMYVHGRGSERSLNVPARKERSPRS